MGARNSVQNEDLNDQDGDNSNKSPDKPDEVRQFTSPRRVDDDGHVGNPSRNVSLISVPQQDRSSAGQDDEMISNIMRGLQHNGVVVLTLEEAGQVGGAVSALRRSVCGGQARNSSDSSSKHRKSSASSKPRTRSLRTTTSPAKDDGDPRPAAWASPGRSPEASGRVSVGGEQLKVVPLDEDDDDINSWPRASAGSPGRVSNGVRSPSIDGANALGRPCSGEDSAHSNSLSPSVRDRRKSTVVEIADSIMVKQKLVKAKVAEDLKMSGFGRFLSGQDLSVNDLDQGVNAMALLDALILTIPYQLLGSVGSDYFDWLKNELLQCSGETTRNGSSYETIQLFYREELLCCIYSSICGLILSTFYFLFKRSRPDDQDKWKSKARMLVIFLFLCTSISLIALMALSNIFTAWYFIPSGVICTLDVDPYLAPAMFFAALTFCTACYLVY